MSYRPFGNRAALAFAFLGVVVFCTPAQAASNVLFILDGSGSMWERVDGQPKIATAKKILDDVLRGLPPDTRLGLMSYGHRRKGDCSDIELISPVGSQNANAVAKKVDALLPKGKTPIAAALTRAAAAFKGIKGPKMIVLVTDGAEECKGNPCAATEQLAAAAVDLHVNIVGFSLAKKERDEVQCIAQKGRGKYYDAKDAKALRAAMSQVEAEVTSARSYSAVGDFSISNNPNGVWSYLYVPSPTKIIPLSAHCSIAGMACWGNGLGVPNFVLVGKNTGGSTLSYLTIAQPTDKLEMDPESYTSIVRFTAPTARTYSIAGHFSGIDRDENLHPVTILDDGAPIYSGTISTFGQVDTFSLSKPLKAGDTIDFDVHTGTAGCSYCYLSTGLDVTITARN